MRLSLLVLSAAATFASASEVKRQNSEATITSPSLQITPAPTPTVNLECFNTSLKPTSQCSVTRGRTLTCLPSVATVTSCKPSNNCFKNSKQEDVCTRRNDKVAPAGIAFAVIVPVVILIIAGTLIAQRIKEKRKRQQALDDRVRGVHMGMTGSRKVEVTFVERRRNGEYGRGEGDEMPLVEYDIPPAYTESDRRRGVPSVSLNGAALPHDDRDDWRDNEVQRR